MHRSNSDEENSVAEVLALWPLKSTIGKANRREDDIWFCWHECRPGHDPPFRWSCIILWAAQTLDQLLERIADVINYFVTNVSRLHYHRACTGRSCITQTSFTTCNVIAHLQAWDGHRPGSSLLSSRLAEGRLKLETGKLMERSFFVHTSRSLTNICICERCLIDLVVVWDDVVL